MIIDKSLLNQSQVHTESAIEFDMINYSLQIMRESMDNMNLLIIQEAEGKKLFSIENILTSIVNGIVKVLKMILGKFLELLVKLASLGKSFELEIRGFKNKIEHYNGSITFEDAYKYTNIFGDDYDNYPSTKLIEYLVDDMNNTISKVRDTFDTSKNKSAKEIKYKAFTLKSTAEKDIAVFRHKLLGLTNNNFDSMSDEIFNLNCFKLFRDNKEVPGTITYKRKEIYEDIYLPYVNQKKSIDRIKKDNNRIQKDIEKSVTLIKDMNFDLSSLDLADQQTLYQTITEIQTSLCDTYQKKCKDIVTMYSAKLQAYKDFIVYAKPWLVKVMKQIAYQGVIE